MNGTTLMVLYAYQSNDGFIQHLTLKRPNITKNELIKRYKITEKQYLVNTGQIQKGAEL